MMARLMTGLCFSNVLRWIGMPPSQGARRGISAILLTLCLGCASASHVRIEPDTLEPHLSWELHAGGDEGDRDFVCGSPQPEDPCVLPASTDNTRVLASIHLLVYATTQPTNYLGFMQAPFFGGEPDRKVGEVNATVEPGKPSVRTTVLGRVTPTPGTYNLTISVDAQPHGTPNSRRISHDVPVLVK
jgi:hypothetical protein